MKALVLVVVIACGRGAVCPRVHDATDGGKGDSPRAKECERRAETPCIRKAPPTLVLIGDDDIDRVRREEHRRELAAWASWYWYLCGDTD